MNKKEEIRCFICGKDLSTLKFRKDYILVAIDDVEGSEFSRLAKPCCKECFVKFVDLNLDLIYECLENGWI